MPSAVGDGIVFGQLGDDYIPNTPMDEIGGGAEEAFYSSGARYVGAKRAPAAAAPGSDPMLARQLGRRSVDKARSEQVAAAGCGGEEAVYTDDVQAPAAAKPAPASDPCVTRDLTNHQDSLPLRPPCPAAVVYGHIPAVQALPPSFAASALATFQELKEDTLAQERAEQAQHIKLRSWRPAAEPAPVLPGAGGVGVGQQLQQQQMAPAAAVLGGDCSPMEQDTALRGTPVTGGTCGSRSGGKWASDVDDDILAAVASLERKVVHQHKEEAQEQGTGSLSVAAAQQQWHLRKSAGMPLPGAAALPLAPAASAVQQPEQQEPKLCPAEGLGAVPMDMEPLELSIKPKPPAEVLPTGWSDTPDSALLASLDRAAAAAEAMCAGVAAAAAAGTAVKDTPPPVKHLSFTPAHAPAAATPRSGGSGQRTCPTSRLGRSALEQARKHGPLLAPSTAAEVAVTEAAVTASQVAELPAPMGAASTTAGTEEVLPPVAHQLQGQPGSLDFLHPERPVACSPDTRGMKRSLTGAAAEAVQQQQQQQQPALGGELLGGPLAAGRLAQSHLLASGLPWWQQPAPQQPAWVKPQPAIQHEATTVDDGPDSKRQRLEPEDSLPPAAAASSIAVQPETEAAVPAAPKGFGYCEQAGCCSAQVATSALHLLSTMLPAHASFPLIVQYVCLTTPAQWTMRARTRRRSATFKCSRSTWRPRPRPASSRSRAAKATGKGGRRLRLRAPVHCLPVSPGQARPACTARAKARAALAAAAARRPCLASAPAAAGCRRPPARWRPTCPPSFAPSTALRACTASCTPGRWAGAPHAPRHRGWAAGGGKVSVGGGLRLQVAC